MSNRDMFRYRKGRVESRIVNIWHERYKHPVVVDSLLLCYGANSEGKEQETNLLRQHEDVVEIAADTLIGWLNSPIGRSFINESFGTDIPLYGEQGAEGK